mgnify:CR=1 FL=1|tara:strand:- start:815 stop:1102 length:288 start_codon:yes stop_codon:yes gene_type:complete
MGVSLKKIKPDPLILNLQPWLLNRYLAKKKNSYTSKGLWWPISLVIIIVTLALLGVSFVKYSQSDRVAMHDKGFNTAVFFYLHSNSGYAKENKNG